MSEKTSSYMKERTRMKTTMTAIYVSFFLSGFAALIYQLVWQRALFTIYGVNIESITVVVAAFMVGLGLGSLLGGTISKTRRFPIILAFGLAEFGIGGYGLGSMELYQWAATLTAGIPATQTFMVAFSLVAAPTVLMGATLPMLVAFGVRRSGNIGRSVGAFYFVNTLGGATACLAIAIWLFTKLGMSGSVNIAAGINILIGAVAILVHFLDRQKTSPATETIIQSEHWRFGRTVHTRLALAAVLAGLVGFISLSYEILWARLYGFAAAGHPLMFPIFLMFFLVGIAAGAYYSQRLCDRDGPSDQARRLATIAWFILAGNIVGFLTIPVLALATASRSMHWGWTLLLASGAAAALGTTFPLISHFSIPADQRTGARLGYVYLANIVGAATGSLLTGFVLLEVWTPQQISVFLILLGCLASAIILFLGHRLIPSIAKRIAGVIIIAIIAVSGADTLFERLYERLLDKEQTGRGTRIEHINENRSGVITVDDRDRVFGGGAYDGVFSVDLVEDRNGIIRPFALSALHAAPRTVLMVGLGSGSWSQVVAHNPDVQKMTIVEINPGYYELSSRNEVTRSLASNPKVEAIIDDARRWLRANPDTRFDAIIANTAFHWRAYATNVLSVEFLELIRRHLNPGGVYYFNSTWSDEAMKTAATIFPYAIRVQNMIAVSEEEIQPDVARWRDVLTNYKIDGKAVLELDRPDHRRRLDEVLSLIKNREASSHDDSQSKEIESREEILARTEKLQLITDDNMLTEWGLARW